MSTTTLTRLHTLPPAPRDLLANRVDYELLLSNHSRYRTVDRDKDSPLTALYRIYEHFDLDQHIAIRNEVETFRYHADWVIGVVLVPLDSPTEWYACLACIPALLCLAFNMRIESGMPRDAPLIFTRNILEAWRAQERKYEKEPAWVDKIPALTQTLTIPHWDDDRHEFVCLENFENASTGFARKNIMI